MSPAMATVENSKEYKKFRKTLFRALLRQTRDVLKSGLLDDIESRIGKADEPIFTEKDLEEIARAIQDAWKDLSVYVAPTFFTDYYQYVYETSGQHVLDALSVSNTFELSNKDVLFQMERRTELLIDSIDNTTKNWLSKQIQKTKEGGFTYQEAAKEIRKRIPETYNNRSEAIVRTETNNMVNDAEYTTAGKNGASHKAWVTAGDDRVSDMDIQNEGEGIVGINHFFSSGHERPPSHPNCRCHLEYDFPPFPNVIWYGQ